MKIFFVLCSGNKCAMLISFADKKASVMCGFGSKATEADEAEAKALADVIIKHFLGDTDDLPTQTGSRAEMEIEQDKFLGKKS